MSLVPRSSSGSPGGRHTCGRPRLFLRLPIVLAVITLFAWLAAPARADGDQPSGSQTGGGEGAATEKKKEQPLRFTDDDLLKFHKPVPAEESREEEAAAAPGGVSQSGTPQGGAAGKPASQRPTVRPAAPKGPPPGDPLKAYHERDAAEKFRAEQIQALRAKIADAQSRVDYLKAKKDALDTPPSLLEPGRTVGQDKQTIPPANLNPGPIFPRDPRAGALGNGKMTGIFPNLPPPQTDEDKDQDAHLKPKELLGKVNDELATAEETLDDLKKQLVLTETRMQRETAPR